MDAFHAIYDRYRADIYRFALFLTGDHAAAEDLVSDTFVRAFTARHRIREVSVKAYLLTITRNLFTDTRRRHREVVPLPDTVPDPSPGVDVRLDAASRLRAVRARLRRVARGDRKAFLMFVVRDMSYAEIASALGITVNAAKSRIFRAREALMRSSVTDANSLRGL